jgi:hypothetical protein
MLICKALRYTPDLICNKITIFFKNEKRIFKTSTQKKALALPKLLHNAIGLAENLYAYSSLAVLL